MSIPTLSSSPNWSELESFLKRKVTSNDKTEKVSTGPLPSSSKIDLHDMDTEEVRKSPLPVVVTPRPSRVSVLSKLWG